MKENILKEFTRRMSGQGQLLLQSSEDRHNGKLNEAYILSDFVNYRLGNSIQENVL